MSATFRCGSAAAAVISCLCIAACGGGGGGSDSNPSMSLSTHEISISANTTDPQPSAFVKLTVTNPPHQVLYVGYATTHNGVDSIQLPSSDAPYVGNILIQFKPPTQLGSGVYTDTLKLAVCLDKQCAKQIANSPQTVNTKYTVKVKAPILNGFLPESIPPGGGPFTLNVTGAGFTQESTVNWNGEPAVTHYASSVQLFATIPATDIENAGSATVTVVNSVAFGGASNPLAFPIQYGHAVVNRVFPNATVEGGPGFTLTLKGFGFGPDSEVQWNGDPRPTNFVSRTELTAQVSAANIASAGAAAVTILNPAPGGSSDPATFTIKPYVSDAVAFQIGANHSGVVHFGTVSFPTQRAWSADVGGKPSYALVADGKVFVTASGNHIFALDQTTGAVVWSTTVGAAAFVAKAAYDAGKIFVVSNYNGKSNQVDVEAFDADTGIFSWLNYSLSGQNTFMSAPTARNGFVYTAGAGENGVTLYALDESTGKITWTKSLNGGKDSTPSVTADGIYLTYPCQAYDFRSGTGELVWHDSSGCSGDGGGTPVVANGKLYAPNETGTYDGDVFDAETGDPLGSYVADNPPAIAKDDGYFLQNGILYDIDLGNNSIVWGFAGDGNLVTSPIVINEYVIIGSSSGNLYALDRGTGQQVWNVNVGAAIPPGAGWGAGIPLSGLAAGHGLLIVPAGDSVIAYRLASD